VKVSGVAASDGPLFVAVNVTLPDVPGVIVGVDAARATSADGVPTTIVVGATVLFAGVGSVVVVDADADPLLIVPGAVAGGIATGTVTVLDAPTARLPATVQVTVPDPSTQPAGSVPRVTPAGGE
jgi:phage tail protein X